MVLTYPKSLITVFNFFFFFEPQTTVNGLKNLPPSFLRGAENETIDVCKGSNIASLSRASKFLEKHY